MFFVKFYLSEGTGFELPYIQGSVVSDRPFWMNENRDGIIDYKKINIGMLGIKIINLCYLVIFGAISLVLLFGIRKRIFYFGHYWILISGLIVFAGWKLSDKAGNINTRRRMEIVLFGIIVLLTLMAVWQLRHEFGCRLVECL